VSIDPDPHKYRLVSFTLCTCSPDRKEYLPGGPGYPYPASDTSHRFAPPPLPSPPLVSSPRHSSRLLCPPSCPASCLTVVAALPIETARYQRLSSRRLAPQAVRVASLRPMLRAMPATRWQWWSSCARVRHSASSTIQLPCLGATRVLGRQSIWQCRRSARVVRL
jgi:hypothetical protein